ncbi:thymidine kinase [Pelagibaculum spongiae]|uniref:Thymidine kinase n=1 Tax=Pelagibaculum spongiae TaxID=2080658 RepID=A0A2V1H0X7_9GAMM|nr:thymidine kinase [Pelagibaculum spongiae]PVZ72133.1 thymidine kinase [Pelagibaculum spongiae]
MAQLYFYYSAMNAGKSTSLLQSSYNYHERGMRTLIYTAALDDRFGQGKVASRIGLKEAAITFDGKSDLFAEIDTAHADSAVHCILVDEAQFLTKQQVKDLSDVADKLSIPVLCYGLRTDFQGELFQGSQYLLAWADKLVELKTICHCGRKASMNLRTDAGGNAVKAGSQVEIGGNDKYVSLCRNHFKQEMGW